MKHDYIATALDETCADLKSFMNERAGRELTEDEQETMRFFLTAIGMIQSLKKLKEGVKTDAFAIIVANGDGALGETWHFGDLNLVKRLILHTKCVLEGLRETKRSIIEEMKHDSRVSSERPVNGARESEGKSEES